MKAPTKENSLDEKLKLLAAQLKNKEWFWHTGAVHVSETEKEKWLREIIETAEQEPERDMWFTTSGDCLLLVVRTEEGNFEVMDLKPRKSAFFELAEKKCTCDTVSLFQFGCHC